MEKDFLSGKKQFLNDNDFYEGQSFDQFEQRSKEHGEGQRFSVKNINAAEIKNHEN